MCHAIPVANDIYIEEPVTNGEVRWRHKQSITRFATQQTTRAIKKIIRRELTMSIKNFEQKYELVTQSSGFQAQQMQVIEFHPIIKASEKRKKIAEPLLHFLDTINQISVKRTPNYVSVFYFL